MQGIHLTADLHNCRCDAIWLTDAAKLAEWCLQAVQSVKGLAQQPASQLFQAFPDPQGDVDNISATLLLPGSHVSMHCWPAQKAVLLDVFLSGSLEGQAATAKALMQALVSRFAPEWTEQRSLDRGDES